MNLLNFINQQNTEQGVIQNPGSFKKEGFKEAYCSSLTTEEKEKGEGTFFIKDKGTRGRKNFIKVDGIWYSITDTVGIPV